jgi:protoporphyrinogen IX oxidase
MSHLFFKSIHIIGFVAWFAGLFYLVRMFVYHGEALQKEQPERDILSRQLHLMEWRVYRIICNPAIVITWIFGGGMLYLHGLQWLHINWWMHVKLVLLVLLTLYHFYCRNIIVKLEKGKSPYSSFQYRLLNEVPTFALVSIVLLAVYKNELNVWYALLGMTGFIGILYLGAKLYNQGRMKDEGKA